MTTGPCNFSLYTLVTIEHPNEQNGAFETLLYLIGATITLYPIGRPVRTTYYHTVSYRETC